MNKIYVLVKVVFGFVMKEKTAHSQASGYKKSAAKEVFRSAAENISVGRQRYIFRPSAN